MKKILTIVFGLLLLASCSSDDEPGAASPEQMQRIGGHWYAELSVSGETDNWRTEEEGDVTSFDKIGALIYLNSNYTDACYWGYLYLQDGDMVNFDGLHRRDDEANFAITMDSEGYITTSSHLKDAPQVTSMHWDNTKDVITADVNYKGQTFKLTFKRVNLNEEQTLKDFYDILAEEGIVGGYADLDTQLNTDVSDNDATGPSRVRRL